MPGQCLVAVLALFPCLVKRRGVCKFCHLFFVTYTELHFKGTTSSLVSLNWQPLFVHVKNKTEGNSCLKGHHNTCDDAAAVVLTIFTAAVVLLVMLLLLLVILSSDAVATCDLLK